VVVSDDGRVTMAMTLQANSDEG